LQPTAVRNTANFIPTFVKVAQCDFKIVQTGTGYMSKAWCFWFPCPVSHYRKEKRTNGQSRRGCMVARSTLSRNFLCILVARMWYLGERKNGTFSRPMASHPTSIEFVLLGGKGVVGSKIFTLICCHWLLTCWLSSTSYGVPLVRKTRCNLNMAAQFRRSSYIKYSYILHCRLLCIESSPPRSRATCPVDIIGQG